MKHHRHSARLTITPARFRITRADAGSVVWTTTYDHDATATLLRRALRIRRATVDAHRHGGATLTWTVYPLGRAPYTVTLTAEPVTATKITPTMLADLEQITGHHARFAEGGTIRISALERIPHARAARLAARALIAADLANPARVLLTLPARLALLTAQHRTRTTTPRGWYRPADHTRPGEWPTSVGLNRPGRRSGMQHDRTSAAICSCKNFHEFADDRTDAARRARRHRQDAAAALVASL